MPYSDLDDEGEINKVGIGFVVFMVVLIVLFGLMCSSCTVGYATDGTTKTFVGAVGGKGAGKSKQIALNWDNEKSFNDVAMVALVAVPAVQAIKVAQSADKLSAIEHTNNTKAAINASNNAAKVELGAQSSALETVKATTLPK